MNPNFQAIGKEFATAYYQLFDTNRSQLQAFYRDQSMLTFEGQQFQGATAIGQKILTMPFQKVQHILTTVDCQPVPSSGVLVFVVGQLKLFTTATGKLLRLKTDDDPPHGFSQTFVLMPEGERNYFVLNDIFRLALHHG